MKIGLISTALPLVQGGGRFIGDWLHQKLLEHGHLSEIIYIPYTDELEHILPQMASIRLMKLDDYFERVITIRPPAHMVQHPRKVVWFIHHLRVFYDLWQTPYCPVPDNASGRSMRAAIMAADNVALGEAQKVFTNSRIVSERLRRFNNLDSEVLYPPVLRPDMFVVARLCLVSPHRDVTLRDRRRSPEDRDRRAPRRVRADGRQRRARRADAAGRSIARAAARRARSARAAAGRAAASRTWCATAGCGSASASGCIRSSSPTSCRTRRSRSRCVRRTNLATAHVRRGAARASASGCRASASRTTCVKPIAWAGPIEDALRAGNPRSALARLDASSRRAAAPRRSPRAHRADAPARCAADDRQGGRARRGEGRARRCCSRSRRTSRAAARPWPRRVFFPKGEVLRAWGAPDTRTPLRGDAIARDGRRDPRASSRARRDAPAVPARGDRSRARRSARADQRAHARRARRSRGRAAASSRCPKARRCACSCTGRSRPASRVDLDLSVALFDASWRHVATCDFTNLVVGGGRVPRALRRSDRRAGAARRLGVRRSPSRAARAARRAARRDGRVQLQRGAVRSAAVTASPA